MPGVPEKKMMRRDPLGIWAQFGCARKTWTHEPTNRAELITSEMAREQPIGPTWAVTGVHAGGDTLLLLLGGYVQVGASGPDAPTLTTLLKHSCGALFTARDGENRCEVGIPSAIIPHVDIPESSARPKPVYIFARGLAVTPRMKWRLELLLHEPALDVLRGLYEEVPHTGAALAIQVFLGGAATNSVL